MTRDPDVMIALPFPPSTNAAYRVRGMFNRGGGRGLYMTTEAKAWKAEAQAIARQAMFQAGARVSSNGVLLYLDLVPATNHRWDIDNRYKLLQDALEGIVYHNDSQIIQKLTTKHPKSQESGAWVSVWYVDHFTPEHPARRFTK